MQARLPAVEHPKLIILCGNPHAQTSDKYERIFGGGFNFGYSDYARVAGCILFAFPVNFPLSSWMGCFPDGDGLVDYCCRYPDALVFSIKPSDKRKARLLQKLPHAKVYYSCGKRAGYDSSCDVSVVDDPARVTNDRTRLWVKGKDSVFWAPSPAERVYDYVMVGRTKKGKNYELFLDLLAKSDAPPRRVLWVAGPSPGVTRLGVHELEQIEYSSATIIRGLLSRSRVGILFTAYPDEGFPQVFLEMVMCGVPVVYRDKAPWQSCYDHPAICVRTGQDRLIASAESLLARADAAACRQVAESRFSLDKSVASLWKAWNDVGRRR